MLTGERLGTQRYAGWWRTTLIPGGGLGLSLNLTTQNRIVVCDWVHIMSYRELRNFTETMRALGYPRLISVSAGVSEMHGNIRNIVSLLFLIVLDVA